MRPTLLILAVLATAPALAEPVTPKAVVEGRYDEIQKILAEDKTDEGVRQKITATLEAFTDFDEFGRLTLKDWWEKLAPKQRTLFIEKFKALVKRSYARRFHAGEPLTVTFTGEPKLVGDKALVTTRVKSGKTTAQVDYKLVQRGDTWKVYDIVIDDVSLVLSYRKQFTKILNKDGFDELIRRMTKKIEEGTGDIEEP